MIAGCPGGLVTTPCVEGIGPLNPTLILMMAFPSERLIDDRSAGATRVQWGRRPVKADPASFLHDM